QLPLSQFKVDEHFFNTLKLNMISGRAFDDRIGDKDVVVINETTARLFGWTPDEALGKRILYIGDDVGPQEVIGVTKDVHFQSLRENIAPAIFFHIKSKAWGTQRMLLVKYETASTTSLLNKIQHRWSA